MTKRLILSLLMIGITIAAVTSATVAYFSDLNTVQNNTFATGNVTIGGTWNLPLNFTNLIPGIEQTQDGSVQYTGTTPADIYIGIADQDSTNGAFYNPTTDTSYMEVALYDKDNSSWVRGWTPVGTYLKEWTKVAENVPANTWRNYTVHVRVYSSVDSSFESKTNISKLIIHAVQTGAPVQLTGAPWQQ